MTGNYSNLTNLFNAQQRMDALKRLDAKNKRNATYDADFELVDTNKNGKIDKKERTAIETDLKNAKNPKNGKVFDFTGDNKVTIEDWSLFGAEIDLNGDGEVSEAEKTFLANQKKSMKKEVQTWIEKDKWTGVFEGTYYKNGSAGTGVCKDDGIYYEKGKQSTGTKLYNNTLYVDGKQAEGNKVFSGVLYTDGKQSTGIVTYNDTVYKDGKPLNGKNENDGKMYSKGKPLTGTASDGLYYEGGVVKSGAVTKKSGSGKSAKTETTYYYEGKSVTQKDLAQEQLNLNIINGYLSKNSGLLGTLTAEQKAAKFDIDGDGDFDADDISAQGNKVSAIMDALGYTDVNGDNNLDVEDINKLIADNDTTAAGKNAKTFMKEYDNLVEKTETATGKKEVDAAQKEFDAAKKAYDNAVKNFNDKKNAHDKTAKEYDTAIKNWEKANQEYEKLANQAQAYLDSMQGLNKSSKKYKDLKAKYDALKPKVDAAEKKKDDLNEVLLKKEAANNKALDAQIAAEKTKKAKADALNALKDNRVDFDDGSYIKTTTNKEGTTSIIKYDAQGHIVYRSNTNAKGVKTSGAYVYNDDGSKTWTFQNTNGRTGTVKFNKDGTKVTSYTDKDGSTGVIKYNSSGKITSKETKKTVPEPVYNKKGKISSWVDVLVTTQYTYKYNKDGSYTVTEKSSNSSTSIVTKYDKNGKEIK